MTDSVFMFAPEVPHSWTGGWKSEPPDFSEPPHDKINSTEEAKAVFDSSSFYFDEMFVGNEKNKIQQFLTSYDARAGKVYFLNFIPGSITTEQNSTLLVKLNNSLNYFLVDSNI